MNIDTQIIYILILIFCCLVLLCITLMYLYITTLNKYTGIKDDPIIETAEKIAKKIIDSAKQMDQKHDQVIDKFISQTVSKWNELAEKILRDNTKILDNNLQKTVESIYKSETNSLDLYKKEKIKEFDDLLAETIRNLSLKIIAKEINLNEHKKLISESLERVREIGLFK